ncbi:DegT/DnrJ/EryC1/StrS family aminotransferase, partial [Acidobacteriota bacterium]
MKVPIIDLRAQYQAIETDVTGAVQDVIERQDFIRGKEVDLFEKEAAEFLGASHAIGVGSGTDALAMALESIGVGPGDAVVTTPFTYFATIEAILQTGAEPIFVDIDPKNFNLDPGALEDYLRKKVRRLPETGALMDIQTGLSVQCILAVHIYGDPADMEAIGRLALRYDLPIVEDA